jgi:hypothetical protein
MAISVRLFPILLLAIAVTARADSTRLLSPLPVSAAAVVAPASDPDHFMFAVGGDNRSAARYVPMPPTARQVFSEFRLLRPAFALWTGDSIYGSDDTVGEARAEYADFLQAAAEGRTPLFNAPGNHEIYDRTDMETAYEATMGRLYGSFDYGHSHFIALDTEEVGHKPGVGRAQRDWLRQDLEANRGAAHIFVFSHHPLFPRTPNGGFANSAARDELHRLFVEFGVKTVFSGHEHLYYKSVHDGITYVVTGGCGASNAPGPEDGGFQHYLLVYVNGDQVSITPLEPWRLFVQLGPVLPDGSCTAVVTNYDYADFSVDVEFPSDALGARAVASASFTYKGWTQPLQAAIVPPSRPGTTVVRVTVPRSRAAVVLLQARPKGAQPQTALPP